MSTQIIIKRSPDEVARSASEWLIESLETVLRVRPFCSIALSGGSTPKRLYELIAEHHLQRVDWSKVVLFWGDERNVPHNDPDSNYRMVREAWLDRAESSGKPQSIPAYFPVPIYPATPERSAREYSDTIRRILTTEQKEKSQPRLDIVLLGLGDDSHTASLFPETLALNVADEIFVSNFVPKLGVYRLTLTIPAINAARSVAFLVCGTSKQAAVEVVWHGPRQGNLYPAQWIQPNEGDLYWFLDLAAVPEDRRSDYSVR